MFPSQPISWSFLDDIFFFLNITSFFCFYVAEGNWTLILSQATGMLLLLSYDHMLYIEMDTGGIWTHDLSVANQALFLIELRAHIFLNMIHKYY